MKGLNKTVFRLGLVSLFEDISADMLFPITPIFLTSILGAPMISVGLIEGCAEAVASLLKTYAGILSDRTGRRKPFILIGYLLSTLSKPWIGLSHSWVGVLGARSSDRFGKGLRTSPRDAMISESIDSGNRAAAFGWHRAMDSIGATLGPLFALLFLNFSANNLRPLYFWALIPGVFSIAVILTLKESSSPTQIPETRSKILWSEMLQSKVFRRFLVGWGIFSITSLGDVFLIMRAQQIGMSISHTVLVYCFFNAFDSLTSPYLGHLADRLGSRPILIGGLLLFAFVFMGFGFADQEYQIWILYAFYGIYKAATDGVSRAHALNLIPSSMKASGLGIVNTVNGLCALVAGVSAGFIWDHYGSIWSFAYGAVGALIAATLI